MSSFLSILTGPFLSQAALLWTGAVKDSRHMEFYLNFLQQQSGFWEQDAGLSRVLVCAGLPSFSSSEFLRASVA